MRLPESARKSRSGFYDLRSKRQSLEAAIQTETWHSVEQFSAEEEKAFKTPKKYKGREADAQVKRYLVDAERSEAELSAIDSENEENEENEEGEESDESEESGQSEPREENQKLQTLSPEGVEDRKPTDPPFGKREEI